MPDLPLPRAGYIAGVSGGRFLVAGGSYWDGGQKKWSARADFFDPVSHRWELAPGLPAPRNDSGIATVGGKVYAFGGMEDGRVTDSSLVFDGKVWTTLTDANLPAPRTQAAAAVISNRIYLFGGLSRYGDIGSATDDLLTWQAGENWHAVSRFPGLTRVSAAVAANRGTLYVFGGVHQRDTALMNLSDAWSYDPREDRWKKLPDAPVARRAWSAVALNEQTILLLGGYTDDFSNEIYAYDLRSRTYRKFGTLPHGIADAKFAIVGRTLVTAGGEVGLKVRGRWTLAAKLAQ